MDLDVHARDRRRRSSLGTSRASSGGTRTAGSRSTTTSASAPTSTPCCPTRESSRSRTSCRCRIRRASSVFVATKPLIRPAELIERKRNGEELAADEIAELILGYARGEIPDYQLAAWCMAVYFRGLTGAETFALTDAMIRSGTTLDLGSRARPARRRQALDGRRRRQDLDRGRADRRRLRRAGREDERPRARAHGRHARQARVDSRASTSSSRSTPSSSRCARWGWRSSARPPISFPPTSSSTASAT